MGFSLFECSRDMIRLWFTRTMLYGKLLEQVFVVKILFSPQPRAGEKMKNAKYMVEVICPIIVNGISTGLVAAHVIMMKVVIRIQNESCASGRKVIERTYEVCVNGIVSRMVTDKIRAIVPPSLFGIDRRMP